MLDGMSARKRKYRPLSVIWSKDESRQWEDAILRVFELLLPGDPRSPVDKGIDQTYRNSHDVSN
jgi:hypothetical protein